MSVCDSGHHLLAFCDSWKCFRHTIGWKNLWLSTWTTSLQVSLDTSCELAVCQYYTDVDLVNWSFSATST